MHKATHLDSGITCILLQKSGHMQRRVLRLAHVILHLGIIGNILWDHLRDSGSSLLTDCVDTALSSLDFR
jgi:hypothetical protein